MAVLRNQRHELFAQELAEGKSASEAYIAAGYKESRSAACRLSTNVNVLARVAELQGRVAEKAVVDAAWVLQRLSEEAEADVADLYDDGRLRPIAEWPLIWRKGLVAGIEIEEEKDSKGIVTGYIKKLRLSDRIKRIELIGKHCAVQAFREQVALTDPAGGPVKVDVVGDMASALLAVLGAGQKPQE